MKLKILWPTVAQPWRRLIWLLLITFTIACGAPRSGQPSSDVGSLRFSGWFEDTFVPSAGTCNSLWGDRAWITIDDDGFVVVRAMRGPLVADRKITKPGPKPGWITFKGQVGTQSLAPRFINIEGSVRCAGLPPEPPHPTDTPEHSPPAPLALNFQGAFNGSGWASSDSNCDRITVRLGLRDLTVNTTPNGDVDLFWAFSGEAFRGHQVVKFAGKYPAKTAAFDGDLSTGAPGRTAHITGLLACGRDTYSPPA